MSHVPENTEAATRLFEVLRAIEARFPEAPPFQPLAGSAWSMTVGVHVLLCCTFDSLRNNELLSQDPAKAATVAIAVFEDGKNPPKAVFNVNPNRVLQTLQAVLDKLVAIVN
jgi:hypothetical protein